MIWIIVLLFIVVLAFVVVWIREPRILLFLFHHVTFPPRKGEPILTDKTKHFPESRLLEQNWTTIHGELLKVMESHKPLPKFHEVDKTNHTISFDDGPAWRTLVLKAYDGWFTANCAKFPGTFRLVENMDNLSTIMFSILDPQVRIPEHTGKFSGIWRYHLALAVPSTGQCFIDVNGEKYFWKTGEGLLFNDTFRHSVTNDSQEKRIVLFVDVKKPASLVTRAVNHTILFLVRTSPIFKRALAAGRVEDY